MSQILSWASRKNKRRNQKLFTLDNIIYKYIQFGVLRKFPKCLVQGDIINHVVNRSSQKWSWHLKRARSFGCDPSRSSCTLMQSLEIMMSTLSAESTLSLSRVGMLEGRRTCHSEDTIGPASQWQSITCAENALAPSTPSNAPKSRHPQQHPLPPDITDLRSLKLRSFVKLIYQVAIEADS